ncbi:Ig-like domain-containing protein [Clostridium sp. YIM B02515]|uniref:Ig-like domain-containing protein n=1 Tax=Clostridium rhizosphaerae TaxID=2803861 RepID=A0ABS1TGZ0_9CLOT|nr:Ig-like domain-containing protein [Clostridium rhizosphaerae]MBL4938047.1 Ig-like domain-containing protein [Clostridium rhizosphaerae]
MRGSYFKKIIVLVLSLLLCISTFTACSTKDKQIVLSNNMSQQAKAEENEISEKIKEGDKYLSDGKYQEARTIYENAISIDKGNKKIYLEIKDSYIKAGRLDDAFYVIKLAIENKVDTDNMKEQLEAIKKKFQVVNLKGSVNQDEYFKLPETATVKINNVDTVANINWNISSIDTGKIGTYIFEGNAQEYERPINFVLTVKKMTNSQSSKITTQNSGSNSKIEVSEQNISEKVKEYIINGQGDKPEAGKLQWSKTFLNSVDIVSLYKKYKAGGGNGQDLESFAKYMTMNASIPNNWKEIFEKDLYNTYGKKVTRLEFLGGDMYQAYIDYNGSEVPYVAVSSRTGYFHG